MQADPRPSGQSYWRERDRYVASLIADGSRVAIPELVKGKLPAAIFRVRDRQGVDVVVAESGDLAESQRIALLRFQFAQYLAAGFLSPDVVFRRQMDHEPAAVRDRKAVLCVALASRDGRVLATLALRGAVGHPGMSLRLRERPLLPLEGRFGWGALNRLPLLADLPLARIREIGGLAKNRCLEDHPGLAHRGALEVCVGMARTLTTALHMEVEAFVGEFEDAVARKSLEFLHTPMVVVRGGLPIVTTGHHHEPGLEGHARIPFAVLVSDMASMGPRLARVEAALSKPSRVAFSELLALKDVRSRPRSSLSAAPSLPRLADTPADQCEMALPSRRRARERGRQLRSFAPFAALSETESTALRPLLEETTAEAGTLVVKRGDPPSGLYLIVAGAAEMRRGPTLPPILLGARDYFGEIALLTRSAHTADVCACSRLRLLRLGVDTYLDHLRDLPEVERELACTALARAVAQLRPAEPQPLNWSAVPTGAMNGRVWPVVRN